jgi:outer membrane lipoprotein-sorting protein
MLRALSAFALACLAPGWAQTADPVLARMDQEAAGFRQMTAKLNKQSFTAVLNEATEESGTIAMMRSGREAHLRIEIAEPEPRSIGFGGSRAQIYYPKINTVQIYDLGKNRGLVDQFLALGFGSSGKELQKNYTVTLAGDETVGGELTARLELVPKSQQAREQFPKIELWIPHNAGHPVQQRLMQPGGDYYLFRFADIKINPGLGDAAFRLDLPGGVKKEYPQK